MPLTYGSACKDKANVEVKLSWFMPLTCGNVLHGLNITITVSIAYE